ncbi:OLC1v1000118C1 [Oldenlandia corymbosa var. corymbosa]|uniref:OLC1v1000118C1 n=1 Tax=Oldenlandia corymbosa var. corymbosa TaxID=529605 RepID=A0AAV1D2H0_OLDCO|nr:OLC1v1000118C1 [Oldenlandia corymbosa var. corymbosa]
MAGGGGGGGGGGPGLAGVIHDPHSIASYSRLLLSDDVSEEHLDAETCFNFTAPSLSSDDQNSSVSSKMLCFGVDPFNGQGCDSFFDEITTKIAIAHKPPAGITCSDSSSSAASTTSQTQTPSSLTIPTANVSTLTKSNKKKNGSGSAGLVNNSCPVVGPAGGNSGVQNGAPAAAAGKKRNCKRAKSSTDDSINQNQTIKPQHAKAKKEKLGERVIALQQLVSPFGKTDTASVLHEAMGYIKFLQDQVQVLCSPYLQCSSNSDHLNEKGEDGGKGGTDIGKDLRNRGLCLVPMELTLHVTEANGADFWSRATLNKFSSSTNQ